MFHWFIVLICAHITVPVVVRSLAANEGQNTRVSIVVTAAVQCCFKPSVVVFILLHLSVSIQIIKQSLENVMPVAVLPAKQIDSSFAAGCVTDLRNLRKLGFKKRKSPSVYGCYSNCIHVEIRF